MLGAQGGERTQSLVMVAESLVWPYVRLFAYLPSQRFIDVFDTLQAISTLCTSLSYFLLSFLIVRHSPPRKRAICFVGTFVCAHLLELNVYRAYLHAYASFGWMLSVFTFIMKPDFGWPYLIYRFRGTVCATNASYNSLLLFYQQTNKCISL